MIYLPLIVLICLFVISWGRIFYLFASGKPVLPPQNHLRRARWDFSVCVFVFGTLLILPSFLLAVLTAIDPQISLEIKNEEENANRITAVSTLEKPSSFQNTNREGGALPSLEKNTLKTETIPATENLRNATAADTSETTKTTEITGKIERNSESKASLSPEGKHPVLVFLTENPSLKKYLFVVCFTVILAPILEEFIFRLLFQGWFDAREREFFARKKENGWRGVCLTAILFCLLHYRSAQNDYLSDEMFWLKNGLYFGVSIFVLFFGIYLLHWKQRLSFREIGLDFSCWKKDVRLGTFAFMAFAAPSYLILAIVNPFLSKYCAGDFIALFPISFGFGILYWRTRRLLPSVVAHSLFNGFAILNCWAFS